MNSQSALSSPKQSPLEEEAAYQIFMQKSFFSIPAQQMRIGLSELHGSIKKLSDYSISMYLEVDLHDQKEETVFFQIGPNIIEKQIKCTVESDGTIAISFITKKGIESFFSQQRLKPRVPYFFFLVVSLRDKIKEISLYLNGKIESQLTMTFPIEPVTGYLSFGSETANKCFRGAIWDAVLYLRSIEGVEIKEIAGYSQGTLKGIQEKNETDQNNSAVKKKTGVPLQLIQTFRENEGGFTPKKEELITKPLSHFTGKLRECLSSSNMALMEKSREISFNFEWIFCTALMMSPPVDDNSARLPFNCLNKFVSPEGNRPFHVIEFMKLANIIKQLGIKIAKEDLQYLVKTANCLRIDPEYSKYVNINFYNKNDVFLSQYVVYDRFLQILRNACLSLEEIKFLKENYRINPLKEEAPSMLDAENSPGLEEPMILKYFTESAQEVGFDSMSKIDLNPNSTENLLVGIRYYVTRQTHSPYELEFIYKNGKDPNNLKITKHSFRNDEEKLSENDLLKKEQIFDAHNPIKSLKLIFTKEFKFLLEIIFILKSNESVSFPLMLDDQGNDSKFLTFSSDQLFEQILECPPDLIINGFFSPFTTIHQKRFLAGMGVYLIKDYTLRKEEEEKEEEESEIFPQLSENWRDGKFQLLINHCFGCANHQTTTWHDEADFLSKFNEICSKLHDIFPNIETIGNWDPPTLYSSFSLFIRGVGPSSSRDSLQRYPLFVKEEPLKDFLNNFDNRMSSFYDNLCLLIAAYGDTMELEKAQEDFFKKNEGSISIRWEHSHDYPANVPASMNISLKRGKSRKEKEKEEGLETGTEMFCKNWGCGKKFKYDDNPIADKESCRYHPGRYEFGSINGLWPESWTCCRGVWEAKGCRKGRHRGVIYSKELKLCINHGPVNPIKKKDQNLRPDSVCGKAFSENGSQECRYHIGHIKKDKVTREEIWSCCNESVANSEPCFTTVHKFAEWPNEEAKIYFVQKEVVNPGIKRTAPSTPFTQTCIWSGFFRKTAPYTSIYNMHKLKLQHEQETENDNRYCLRWACEKEFKQVDNKKKKLCKYHSGTWDFGHSGITVSKAFDEFNKEKSELILWKPHWTCCRKSWESEGCTKGYHKGPLMAEMADRKYKWPSEHAQKYFWKKVSPFWMEKVESERLNEEEVDIRWKVFSKDYGSQGKIGISLLPRLCDKLKLHLLVISDDLSFHFKFLDVMTERAQRLLDDGNGNIEKSKFMSWWFADLEKIRPL